MHPMPKITTALALAVIGASQPEHSFAQGNKVCAVTTSSAPVHAGPSSSSRFVMRAGPGHPVDILGRSGDWVRVMGDGELGEHGYYGTTWIQSRYLSIRPCN